VRGRRSWHSAGVATKSKSGKASKRKPKKQPVKARAAKKRAATAMKHGPRADFGAPIAGFFQKQPAPLRPVLESLRKLIERAAPDAESSITWGMPFYTIGGAMFCALGGHKSHVNLILSGPPGTFDDPEKRLTGAGKTGRHLKLRSVDEIPTKAVQEWLRTAANLARKKA
jgi:hypothetical protein